MSAENDIHIGVYLFRGALVTDQKSTVQDQHDKAELGNAGQKQ